MPMRPVNFTHYTPIIRFLAEPDRDLVLSPDVITRCRFAEWMEENCGGVGARARARPRVSMCVCVCISCAQATGSDGFNFYFPYLRLRFLFPAERRYRASPGTSADGNA